MLFHCRRASHFNFISFPKDLISLLPSLICHLEFFSLSLPLYFSMSFLFIYFSHSLSINLYLCIYLLSRSLSLSHTFLVLFFFLLNEHMKVKQFTLKYREKNFKILSYFCLFYIQIQTGKRIWIHLASRHESEVTWLLQISKHLLSI